MEAPASSPGKIQPNSDEPPESDQMYGSGLNLPSAYQRLTANDGFNGCHKLKVSEDRMKGLSRRRNQSNPGV
jgi:hypothetical protein